MVITGYQSSSNAVQISMNSHERQWRGRIMVPDLFWIPGPWPGRLAISARPRGGDWLEDEAKSWRRAGIDLVVSLLENEEASQLELLDERTRVEDSGIEFMSFPIRDRGVPDSTPEAISLLTRIVDALEAGKSVALHCRQGIGRSGLIAAGVLIVSGIAPQEAIRMVTQARGTPVPETTEQILWTQHLPSGLLLSRH